MKRDRSNSSTSNGTKPTQFVKTATCEQPTRGPLERINQLFDELEAELTQKQDSFEDRLAPEVVFMLLSGRLAALRERL